MNLKLLSQSRPTRRSIAPSVKPTSFDEKLVQVRPCFLKAVGFISPTIALIPIPKPPRPTAAALGHLPARRHPAHLRAVLQARVPARQARVHRQNESIQVPDLR